MSYKNIAFIIFPLALSLPLWAYGYTGEISVDAGPEFINALEGTVHIPRGVNITELETGHSALLIWIKPPALDTEARTISFSGISPGGFQGKRTIFAFTGELTESDLANFTYSDIKAFKNDGSGTPASASLSVRKGERELDDLDAPEAFIPAISRSPDIFGGHRFVSFLTQDKGTGVAGYESASSWLGSPSDEEWVSANSPLELKSSDLFKQIYIRAIDNNGNVRVVSIAGSYRYASILFGIIIMACVLLFLRRSFRSSSYPLS